METDPEETNNSAISIFLSLLELVRFRNNVTKVEQTSFGTRYVIEGFIETPDKRNPKIRSVWFVKKNTEIPCFVTSYPKKERSNDKRVR